MSKQFIPSNKKFVNVNEFQEEAEKRLNHNAYTYYKSGANDEIALQENLDSWKRIFLIPYVLRNVDNVDTTTTVLGQKISFPLGICPTAMHKMAHPDGEMATAKAAHKQNIAFTLSTLSTCNHKEVSEAQGEGAFRWYQLYATKNRKYTMSMIKEAELTGFQALVVTVDVPIFGKRDGDEKNSFKLPSEFSLKMLREQDEKYTVINKEHSGSALVKLSEDFKGQNWDEILWYKSVTKLPIIIKGIMCAEDALKCVEVGADAIWVSNHGGRQLDTVLAPIDVLEDIANAVKGKCEIYIDGGIRRGSDIFKALALGARCCFVGRPSVFSLACGGQEGVEKMISILREEFKKTMMLCGVNSVQKINKSYLVPKNQIPWHKPKL